MSISRLFVRLVEKHGERVLIRVLESTVASEDKADLITTTAHKAKGREWDTVGLTNDFLLARNNQPPDESEIRLFYVAMTRARKAVDIPPTLAERFGI